MNRRRGPEGSSSFRVAVLLAQAHGFARLTVEAGQLEVVVDGLTRLVAPRGPLVQHARSVTVYAAAIGFPPFLQATGVVVRPHDTEPVLAVLPRWQRQPLLAALEGGGFEVDLRRTLFGVGQRNVARF